VKVGKSLRKRSLFFFLGFWVSIFLSSFLSSFFLLRNKKVKSAELLAFWFFLVFLNFFCLKISKFLTVENSISPVEEQKSRELFTTKFLKKGEY